MLALPSFVIVQWPRVVYARPSSMVKFYVSVKNGGLGDGDVTIRVVNHNGGVVFNKTVTVRAGQLVNVGVELPVVEGPGVYGFSLQAYN